MRFINIVSVALAVLLMYGCAARTPSDVHRLQPDETGFDQSKAVLIGIFSEGYLYRPHLPVAFFKSREINEETGKITSFGLVTKEDDDPSPNVTASAFAIQLPPGDYYMDKWAYVRYAGESMDIPDKPSFTLNAGDVAFIGEIRAIALNMCLKVYEKTDERMERIFSKYPFLKGTEVRNLMEDYDLREWPHSAYQKKVQDNKCVTVEQLLQK